MEAYNMGTRKVVSQPQKILNFLNTGQARSRLGIQQLPARVSELRAAGYAIYTNVNKAGNTTYRLGTPSRAMVAAAHAANVSFS